MRFRGVKTSFTLLIWYCHSMVYGEGCGGKRGIHLKQGLEIKAFPEQLRMPVSSGAVRKRPKTLEPEPLMERMPLPGRTAVP